MKLSKKAFTLIELLVVIAIIAILAAILFPVFAQAKDSAKDAANLSNLKQLALANIMYSADYDDNFPLSAWIDNTGNFTTWQQIVMPYIKSQQLILDTKLPAPPSPTFENGNDYFYVSNSEYGVSERETAIRVGSSGLTVAPDGKMVFGNSTRTGHVTNGQLWEFDGVFGAGVDPKYTNAFYAYQTAPSMSQTDIDQPANNVMVSQTGNWGMWWGAIGYGMHYFVKWIAVPGSFTDPNIGTDGVNDYSWSGPHARKRPACGVCSGIADPPPASTAPAAINGIPDGQDIYATCDGSAHSSNTRGDVNKPVVTSSGITILNRMWPTGR